MRLSIIGSGYVGLVSAACFAEMGNIVSCVEKDPAKVQKLQSGIVPFYEPGLAELVTHNFREGRLIFTTDVKEGVKEAEVIFIAVGTPSDHDGSADLRDIRAAAAEIAPVSPRGAIVAVKSTVPVGTCDIVEKIMTEIRKEPVCVVSNPEFLKEGNAIRDFLYPDRVIVGTVDERAKQIFFDLFAPYTKRGQSIIFMSRRSSELTKYTANTFLAMRISFINEISMLCEAIGANVEEVRIGVGSDSRIGQHFLFPGVGYGGSCFPKDVRALIKMGRDQGLDLGLPKSTDDVNMRQRERFTKKILERFNGDLTGRIIAVAGLAFKPQTDDVREAPAIDIIRAILDAGGAVRTFDPAAMENARAILNSGAVQYSKSLYEACENADALAVITEWNEFRRPDFDRIKSLMKTPIIFDGRNIYNPQILKDKGFEYFGIGVR